MLHLSENLRKYRILKNLTQEDVAEYLGITPQSVSKWERGKGLPDASLMLELCEILGVTVNELLCGEKIDMENKMRKEQEEEQAMTASELAAQRDEARQAAEAAEAQKLLAELSETSISPKEDAAEPAEEEGNSPAETINPPSEDEKRKAHEEAEAKRKAEWEAKKREREEADTMAWEAAIAMDDDALMEASSNRLAADAERITRRNMKQCVTEYVQALCFENLQFAQQVMHPRKSMINCFKYINRKALEYLKQEMQDNGEKTTGISAIGGDVSDELCYQWAEEYFRDLNAPEDKTDADKEYTPKSYSPSAAKSKTKEPKKKAEPPKKEKPAPKPPATEPEEDEGQQSLFDEVAA